MLVDPRLGLLSGCSFRPESIAETDEYPHEQQWPQVREQVDRKIGGRAARRGGDRAEEEIAERALAGLAFHAEPTAPLALVHLAREGATEELRAQALFWLAQTDDSRAARWIREAIARDPAEEVREQGVFALSQLDDATPQLLALLRESEDRDVKRQAIFWLGQSDDPRATAELERLLTR